MKKINILEKIYVRKLTEGKGNKIIRDLLDSKSLISKTNNILEIVALLGFSKKEWYAYSASAPLKVIAKWKYEGWPSECMVVGKKINLEKLNWIIARDVDGKYGIENLDEDDISAQSGYYRHKKKNFPAKFCCQMMRYYLKSDDPSIIAYTKKSNEYGIRIFDGGYSYIIIRNCPWCGKLLRLKK